MGYSKKVLLIFLIPKKMLSSLEIRKIFFDRLKNKANKIKYINGFLEIILVL